MPNDSLASTSSPSLAVAIIVAGALVAVDAFVLNQGALTLLVALYLLFVSLPITLLRKKYAGVRIQHMRNLAVYAAAIALVFGLNAANNAMARDRAEVIIAAVNEFNAKNARYPDSLTELVPDFLEKVPLAKYTLNFNSFEYIAGEQDATLMYLELPPFGRSAYRFEKNEWGYMD